jgi:hypothetical protein
MSKRVNQNVNRRMALVAAGLVAAGGLTGCANHAQTGALAGAALGGAVDGERGMFVGGVTGYMIGNEMDKGYAGGHRRKRPRHW